MACQRGEEGVTCLRDSSPDHRCCIADEAPALWPCNDAAVDIFYQAQLAAERVETKRKVLLYVRPVDVEALLRVHGVPEEEWVETYRKVISLQDVFNDLSATKRRR